MRRNILVGILVCVVSIFIVGRFTAKTEQPSPLQIAAGNLLNKVNDNLSPPRATNVSLTPAKAWALGASALLTERNGERHDSLGGVPLTEEWAQSKREVLGRVWGVNNKTQMLEVLHGLRVEGHRAQYESKGNYIMGLNDEGYQSLLERLEGSPDELHQAEMLKKYYRKYGKNYLLAWDYVRYINLCRWGYVAGYLSEAEAWELIMPAAVELQKNFHSWKEMSEGFLFGREFWSYSEMQRTGQLYVDAEQRLLDDPLSPWNKSPWNLRLAE